MINHYKEEAIINMPVSNNSKVDDTSEQSIRQYPDAYHFYRFALHTLLENQDSLINEASLMDIIGKLRKLHDKKYISWDENKFLLLGSILTNLGDCVFAYLNEKHIFWQLKQQDASLIRKVLPLQLDPPPSFFLQAQFLHHC